MITMSYTCNRHSVYLRFNGHCDTAMMHSIVRQLVFLLTAPFNLLYMQKGKEGKIELKIMIVSSDL